MSYIKVGCGDENAREGGEFFFQPNLGKFPLFSVNTPLILTQKPLLFKKGPRNLK